MDILSISNKTNLPLRVMLEPLADTFDIAPSDTAEVTCEFALHGQPVEVEFHPENFISIWTIGEVRVNLGDTDLRFPEIS